MAAASDVCTAIVAALTEIGMTGVVRVDMDGMALMQAIGQSNDDDVLVAVTVTPLGDG